MSTQNLDPAEIAKFSAGAAHWWDPHGEFKTLHEINPLRLDYINQRAPLVGKKVIDIGCGGGILSESIAKAGANVTGIDMSEAALNVARLHQYESGVDVEYILTPAEDIAVTRPHSYDIVTCLEMLEHVPDPASIVKACAALVKPGGHVFFSTLNRNIKSYLFAVIGAEYVMRWLPQNTHDYAKFIRPSELEEWGRLAGLSVKDITGLEYHLLTQQFALGKDVSVNYLMYFRG